MGSASNDRVYVYRIGPFTLLILVLFSASFALAGLFLIVESLAADPSAVLALIGLGFLLIVAFIVRWMYRDHISSKVIVFGFDKVQRPLTAGRATADYLLFEDVLSAEIDRDYHDHGPALVVSTTSKPVAYKSMYFETYKAFEDFCEHFEEVLEHTALKSLR